MVDINELRTLANELRWYAEEGRRGSEVVPLGGPSAGLLERAAHKLAGCAAELEAARARIIST